MMTPVDATVVVCTYNRAGFLRQALESLGALETDDRFRYEVLVVDNGSTDHTRLVIEEVAARVRVPVRGVWESRQGISSARNRGIQEARGPWIAFFDDDQLAHPRWLAELLAVAGRTGARYVAGERRLSLSETELQSLPALCRRILGELVQSDRPFCYPGRPNASTGNVLIHRSVFEEIGWFNETLLEAGEDADLNRRVGEAKVEAWYTPRARVWHVVPAYRLGEDYFRWTCRRHGTHVARRDRKTWGAAMFPLVLAARICQAALWFVPGMFWAWWRRDRRGILAARCRLWRAQGCLRASLQILAPRLFAQQRFFKALDFRGEREVFAIGEGGVPSRRVGMSAVRHGDRVARASCPCRSATLARRRCHPVVETMPHEKTAEVEICRT